MAQLGLIECAALSENTGFGTCFLDPKKIEGAIISDKPFSLTKEEMADLQNSLQSKFQSASKSNRIYPIHGFAAAEDQSEEATIETLDYGDKTFIKEGDYDWRFRFLNGGVCLLTRLQAFNGQGKHVMFYDNTTLFGYKDGTSLRSVPLNFFLAEKWQPATGSTGAMYRVRFSFKPEYINQGLGFVKYDFIMAELKGLNNVELVVLNPEDFPSTINVQALAGCSGENLFDTYSEEMEDDELWLATDEDGEEVTISGVVADDATKSWEVSFSGSPAYVKLTWVNPNLLSDAGIDGYEAKTTVIEEVES